MDNPYIGQLLFSPYSHPIDGWARCEGQLIDISGNEYLFNLIGKTFGGDGVNNFALPDLRARVPVGTGKGSDGIDYSVGDKVGAASVTLTPDQLPAHSHKVVAGDGPPSASSPRNAFISPSASNEAKFAAAGDGSTMNAAMVQASGDAAAAHENRQPFLASPWIIALYQANPGPPDLWMGSLMLIAGPPPDGWVRCEGQIMNVAQNPELFRLIGGKFGGDGRTTFALPDLRGRVPVGAGHAPGLSNYDLGQGGGAAAITLSDSQVPPHTHAVQAAAGAAGDSVPSGNLFAAASAANYQTANINSTMNPSMIQPVGGQAHENRMPSLALNWVICLKGMPIPVNYWTGQMALIASVNTPEGWLPCEGQPLDQNGYRRLYSLIGNLFGGDGVHFRLPDLRGRVPMGASPEILQGTYGGTETVTLDPHHLPPHSHAVSCDTQGATAAHPSGAVPSVPGSPLYASPSAGTAVMGPMLEKFGQPGPHDNRQPYLALRWVIATTGSAPWPPAAGS